MLIMADEFRTMYLKSNIVYANQFMLDAGSGEFWTLYDSDMELPAFLGVVQQRSAGHARHDRQAVNVVLGDGKSQ